MPLPPSGSAASGGFLPHRDGLDCVTPGRRGRRGRRGDRGSWSRCYLDILDTLDDLCLSYFQFIAFPSDNHSTAVASRRARVSSPLAVVIHSRYSRLWLGGKLSNVVSAFLFFLRAAMKYGGAGIGFLGCFGGRAALTPRSLIAIAFLM